MAAGRKAIDISEWLTPENKLRIQGWCRDGLIEKQIDCCWIQLQRSAGGR